MAKADYYFPLYYKRLLTSTIGWKDDEFGAYVRLLIHQFDNGAIPSEMNELKRISPSIQKHWPLIKKKFKDNGNGGLVNEVMNDVRIEADKKSERAKKNGLVGGRPKKPTANLQVISRFPNQNLDESYPITNNQEPIKREIFKIEHCLVVALNDNRWVKANHTHEKELKEFNSLLEKRGIYEKNPLDYKNHFANWKNTGKKDIKTEPELKTSFNPALNNKIS